MKPVSRDLFYLCIGPLNAKTHIIGDYPYTVEMHLPDRELIGKQVPMHINGGKRPIKIIYFLTEKYYQMTIEKSLQLAHKGIVKLNNGEALHEAVDFADGKIEQRRGVKPVSKTEDARDVARFSSLFGYVRNGPVYNGEEIEDIIQYDGPDHLSNIADLFTVEEGTPKPVMEHVKMKIDALYSNGFLKFYSSGKCDIPHHYTVDVIGAIPFLLVKNKKKPHV